MEFRSLYLCFLFKRINYMIEKYEFLFSYNFQIRIYKSQFLIITMYIKINFPNVVFINLVFLFQNTNDEKAVTTMY